MKRLFFALLFISISLFTIKVSDVNAQTCTTTPPTNTGKITLTATITSAGDYRVWSRIKIPDANNNSFYLQIDGGCAILVGGSTSIPTNTWTWIDYQNGTSSNKINANLTTGDHVLTIIGNGTSVGVDKLLLTQNQSCIPTGNGDNCPAVNPTNTPTPTNPPPTSTPSPGTTTTPVVSPSAGSTTLNFSSIKLHGLGKGGDNTNANSLGSQNLTRKTRPVTIELEDDKGNTLPSIQGNLVYNDTTGDFSGSIVIPDTVPSGQFYLVRVKTPQFLKKRANGIYKISTGQAIQMPAMSLVTGDINDDNKLTITDYNLLIDCYADFLPAKNCDAAKKIAADLWDDGNVNAPDYNIFIKELSVVSGD